MPTTIEYANNPNEETAFVTPEGGQRTRAVLTTTVDGTVKFPDNPNSTKVSVTIDGVARKAVAVYNVAGGGDQHNLGYYATQAALEEAHPTAEAGDWAIVGATDTVWIWDTDNSEWVDSDQKGQVTSVNGQTGDVVLDLLPSQTGHSGEFLTTDGTDASWSDKPLVNTATGGDYHNITVLGTPASTSYAINIGANSQATQNNTTAVGSFAKASGTGATALGRYATASGNYSVCLGNYSTASGANSITIGLESTASAANSIEISTYSGRTNSDANTFKVGNANGNFEIMSADGTIPTARLTKANTAVTLAVADWSSSTQTVSVTGVTATSVVLVAPDSASQSDYTSAGILCTAQGAGTLTFTCSTTPTNAITVNVVAL